MKRQHKYTKSDESGRTDKGRFEHGDANCGPRVLPSGSTATKRTPSLLLHTVLVKRSKKHNMHCWGTPMIHARTSERDVVSQPTTGRAQVQPAAQQQSYSTTAK